MTHILKTFDELEGLPTWHLSGKLTTADGTDTMYLDVPLAVFHSVSPELEISATHRPHPVGPPRYVIEALPDDQGMVYTMVEEDPRSFIIGLITRGLMEVPSDNPAWIDLMVFMGNPQIVSVDELRAWLEQQL